MGRLVVEPDSLADVFVHYGFCVLHAVQCVHALRPSAHQLRGGSWPRQHGWNRECRIRPPAGWLDGYDKPLGLPETQARCLIPDGETGGELGGETWRTAAARRRRALRGPRHRGRRRRGLALAPLLGARGARRERRLAGAVPTDRGPVLHLQNRVAVLLADDVAQCDLRICSVLVAAVSGHRLGRRARSLHLLIELHSRVGSYHRDMFADTVHPSDAYASMQSATQLAGQSRHVLRWR
mmetsp:Transcript_30456/g.76914  ORF Transcript_30456/g.76914 Transcript_30456/m.76914 type:complete len:238 (+) Transcript_30456:516-1229(+)